MQDDACRSTERRLGQERRAAGIDAAEVVGRLGVSEGQLAEIESGDLPPPDLGLLLRIAAVLGVKLSMSLDVHKADDVEAAA